MPQFATQGAIGLIGLVLGAAAPLAAQQPALATDPWSGTALEFVQRLEQGEYAAAAGMVDASVPAGALDAAKLEEIWTAVVGQVGQLLSVQSQQVREQQQGLRQVDLAARFEQQAVRIRIVLTAGHRLAGLWFLPPEPPPYEPPAYADTAVFRERNVVIGAEPWYLGATLTLPEGPGPFPAVVLVHGSGPNDRDETIGPNRPFRDLAWGLASRGFAVLRYDKRTFTYGARMAPDSVTIDTEVIDDVLAALAALRQQPEVDDDRVFLLGHSLGAFTAPIIAERDGRLAGVIMLATSARPIADVIRGQLAHLASLAPAADAATRARTEALVAQIDSLAASSLPPDARVLGAPVRYWQELDALRPIDAARRIDEPLLILQGERDYQVTMEDFRIWQEALQGRPGTTLRSFPRLDHLFMAGEGPSSPQEYMAAQRHVAPEVVDAITAWMRAAPSP